MRRDSNTENTPSLLTDLSSTHVPLRRRIPEWRDEYDVLEVAPRRCEERRTKGGDRRRETVYVTGRGSLYEKDEGERRRRRQEQGPPVIVYAEPRRGKTYHLVIGFSFLGSSVFPELEHN